MMLNVVKPWGLIMLLASEDAVYVSSSSVRKLKVAVRIYFVYFNYYCFMKYLIPVFLSYPKPFTKSQADFVNRVCEYLEKRGFIGRTLGVTDYDMEEPLTAIRRLMLDCNGLVTIAFRRSYITSGVGKPASDVGETEYSLSGKWLTSPYCHIEPAMAFQVGLPILILREEGVIADGILEKGVSGTYLPEFSITGNWEDYFESTEWCQVIGQWEGYVRRVVSNKGKPPRLY